MGALVSASLFAIGFDRRNTFVSYRNSSTENGECFLHALLKNRSARGVIPAPLAQRRSKEARCQNTPYSSRPGIRHPQAIPQPVVAAF